MNVAKSVRADEVKVRSCLFVMVLNARGRNVAGGRRIGKADGLAESDGFDVRGGCRGVLNAGEEEGMALRLEERSG